MTTCSPLSGTCSRPMTDGDTGTAAGGPVAPTGCRHWSRRTRRCRCSTAGSRSAPGRASAWWTSTWTTRTGRCGSPSSPAEPGARVILGLNPGGVALLAVVVVLGSTMQGLVGLGLNLVSAPIVTMVAPSLMPEPPLVLAVLLPFLTLARSHEGIDWGGLAWVLPARVPGVVLGVAFLAAFSDRAVAVAVGVMVLLAVLVSLAPLEVPVRRST